MPQLPHDHGQHMEKEFDHMPKLEDFQIVSDIFKQLCDGSRIRIFWAALPLRGMRHKSFFNGGYEQPGRFPSFKAA